MRKLPSFALLSLFGASFARADLPQPAKAEPKDFASGVELTLEPGLAVQTLLLPLEVYRGAQRDLSDLGVFDAEGHPVAWATRMLSKTEELRQREEPALFFPIYGQASARASTLALKVERSASGTVIAVHAPDAPKPAEDAKLLTYIVHAGALSEDITAVRFELEPGAASYVLPLQIEGSDNLSDWRVLANGDSIGRLVHGDQVVERTRIAVSPTRATFLRITWSGELPAAVRQIHIERQRVQATNQREPRQLTIGPIALVAGAYRLDLGGTLMLESVLPRLPLEDVLLKVSLFDGSDESAQLRFSGLLYRLSHASVVLSSPAIPLPDVRARVLSFVVDTRASQPPQQPLTFDVNYLPDQLLFVPHGARPHLLAFGSYRALSAPLSAEQLTAFLSPEQRAQLPLESARAGALKTLGGETARRAPPKSVPARTLWLWGVLIVGAGTLILLALRLLKKTGRA